MGSKLSKKKKISHQRSRTPSQDSRSSMTYEEEKCYDPSDSTLTFVDGDDELDCKSSDYEFYLYWATDNVECITVIRYFICHS